MEGNCCIICRLGNLRSAKIGESFHLSLGLLSLHFQTLLEQRKPLDSDQDHKNSTLPLRYHYQQI